MSKNKNRKLDPINKAEWGMTAGAVAGLIIGAGVVGAKKLLESGSQETKDPKVYVVKPGDTPWTIAEKANPNSDPREFADRLGPTIPHDSLHQGEYLQPGDKLYLPSNSEIGKAVILKNFVEVPSYAPTKRS